MNFPVSVYEAGRAIKHGINQRPPHGFAFVLASTEGYFPHTWRAGSIPRPVPFDYAREFNNLALVHAFGDWWQQFLPTESPTIRLAKVSRRPAVITGAARRGGAAQPETQQPHKGENTHA